MRIRRRGAVNFSFFIFFYFIFGGGADGLQVHDIGSHRPFLLCGHISPPSGENAVGIYFQ